MDHGHVASVTYASLPERLAVCAAKIGGKRALAAAAGISEAQLFRYISGESEMPAARVLAIATASGVQPGWLLTGVDATAAAAPKVPEFRAELLAQISQTLDEVLVDHPRPLPPSRKGKLLSFMYQAMRHEEMLRGAPVEVVKANLLAQLDFLNGPRGEDTLNLLAAVMQREEYSAGAAPLQDLEADLLCKTLQHAFGQLYSSISGQIYFERMTDHVPPTGVRRLNSLMELLRAAKPNGEVTIVDVGCGNGREMSFLHRHHANLRVLGVEPSTEGINLCESAMRVGRLPAGFIRQGTMTALPLDDASTDAVYNNMALSCLPYLPNFTEFGAHMAFAEAARVLKPGGIFYLTTLHGTGREYLTFAQLHNEDTLRELAHAHGLDIHLIEAFAPPKDVLNNSATSNKFDRKITAILKKPQ